jgi:hypothetical protein
MGNLTQSESFKLPVVPHKLLYADVLPLVTKLLQIRCARLGTDGASPPGIMKEVRKPCQPTSKRL